VPSGQFRYAAGTPQRVCSQLVAAGSLFAEFISVLDSKDVWIDSSLLGKKGETFTNAITIIFISSITLFVSLFPLVLIIFLFLLSLLFCIHTLCATERSVNVVYFV